MAFIHRPLLRVPDLRYRRAVGAIALASVAALVVSACSSTGAPAASTPASSGGSQVTLTMWQQWGGGHERQMLDQLIATYEKSHPGVTIKETPVTNNAKILAAITGGNPPDIVDLGNSLPLGAWASAGALTDLGPMIKSSGLDTSVYVQSAFDALKVNGKVYGLPFQIFNAGLIYNKTLLQDAGLKPPTTLQELAKDAALLTKTNSSGQLTQVGFLPTYPGPSEGQTCPLISYTYAFGGSWFKADGTATPNTPQSVAALTWEKQIFDALGPSKAQAFISSTGSYLTQSDPLESGKVAMMFDGPWAIQFAKDNAPGLAKQLAVVPFPASDTSAGSAGSTYIDANAQIIPQGSKHVQEAFDFIKWETTNAEETGKFSNDIANIPQLRKVPDFPLLKDANFAEFVKIANGKNARSWMQTPTSTTYGTNICKAQDAVLLNGQSPQAALAGIATS